MILLSSLLCLLFIIINHRHHHVLHSVRCVGQPSLRVLVSRVQDLTWPVGDQTMSALCLHLDVSAAGGLQWQDMRPICGLVDLLPETSALQRASDQPATGEGAGRRPRDVAQRCHWTPGNIQSLTSDSFQDKQEVVKE